MNGPTGVTGVRLAPSRLRSVLPPIVVGVGLLVAWQLFVQVRHIKPYLLPAPSAIWHQILGNRGGIIHASRVTGTNALIGLVAGTALGIGAGAIASRFRFLGELTTPVAVAVNAVPIIALVPIFNNMFSTTSAIPRRLMVTIIVFFPIFMNTLRGLTQKDATKEELMRSYAASEGTILRKVRVPNAMPFLFTGLKIASSLSVIAAVVAEYFGGFQDGLGSHIVSAASNSAYGRAWAFVAASCVLGLAFYLVTILSERMVIPWQQVHRSR
ncbi:MAG: ABC transporter permease [Actinomycetota bacterium]|nr:ABC transporter permease [Actinomycetota bacterium]MDQ6949029.1 ABC transporter permease [Actinomycetota bacterium]